MIEPQLPFRNITDPGLGESIGNEVLIAVRRLKHEKLMRPYNIPIVMFLADSEYDVCMTVSIEKKESQTKLVEEMFSK